jgi:hypothetical protein
MKRKRGGMRQRVRRRVRAAVKRRRHMKVNHMLVEKRGGERE